MRQLFSIGKIIQIRTGPLTVTRLAFMETEEHIRHVVEMLKWLNPNASETLCRAAELHDIGKKIYLQHNFVQSGRKGDSRLSLSQKNLRADFYQQGSVMGLFTPDEAMKRYLAFLERGYAKCFVVRQNAEDTDSEIVVARYQLDPPFDYHAASVEVDDLQGVSDADLSYVYSLIQLHHNFQVDKLVTTAAQHGEDIIADLYRLMTADQEGSRWAECVVQKLEKGEEKPQSKFGFSEFAVEAVAEPTEVSRSSTHVQGQVILKATRRLDLGELTLTVDYYVSDCEFLNTELATKKKGGKNK